MKFFAILSLIPFLAVGEPAEDLSESLAKARAYFQNRSSNLKSGEIHYLIEEEQVPFDKLLSKETYKTKTMYVFKFKDSKKRLDAYIFNQDQKTPTLASSTAFDGQQFYSYNYLDKNGSIAIDGAFPMTYEEYVYPVKGGLLEFLSNDNIMATTEIIDKIKFPSFKYARIEKDSNFTSRVVLDPKANYQPKLIQRYSFVPEKFKDTTPIEEDNYVVNVAKYTEVDGFYFPSEVHSYLDYKLDTGETVRSLSLILKLVRVSPNVEFDDRVFKIEFPQGTKLSHYDYKITHVVGSVPPEFSPEAVFGADENPTSHALANHNCSEVNSRHSKHDLSNPQEQQTQPEGQSSGNMGKSPPFIMLAVAAVGILGLFLFWVLRRQSTNSSIDS